MKILDYNKEKKQICIDDAIYDQICLIQSIKAHYPELKKRLNLKELKALNEIIYDLFASKNSDNYFECMDRIISNSLYKAISENEKFDVDIIKKNLFIMNEYFNILVTYKARVKINKLIPKDTKIIKFK